MKYTDLEYVEWTKIEDKTELNKNRYRHRYIFRLTKRQRETEITETSEVKS